MRRATMILLSLLVTTALHATTLHESIDKTFDVRPGAELTLSNVNGRVEISTWDQPRIRVRAEKVADSRDQAAAKSALRELQVEIQPHNGGLSIHTREPRQSGGNWLDYIFGDHVNTSVTYQVTLPRQMNAKVETVNGRLLVSDLTGTLQLETTNGRIEVVRCAGSVNAETTNGGINVELVRVSSGPMKFETTNGAIKLSVPPTLAATIDAGTTNGRIKSDLPVTTKNFEEDSLRGTLNGGGPQIKLRTTNGRIEIAATGGGVAAK